MARVSQEQTAKILDLSQSASPLSQYAIAELAGVSQRTVGRVLAKAKAATPGQRELDANEIQALKLLLDHDGGVSERTLHYVAPDSLAVLPGLVDAGLVTKQGRGEFLLPFVYSLTESQQAEAQALIRRHRDHGPVAEPNTAPPDTPRLRVARRLAGYAILASTLQAQMFADLNDEEVEVMRSLNVSLQSRDPLTKQAVTGDLQTALDVVGGMLWVNEFRHAGPGGRDWQNQLGGIEHRYLTAVVTPVVSLVSEQTALRQVMARKMRELAAIARPEPDDPPPTFAVRVDNDEIDIGLYIQDIEGAAEHLADDGQLPTVAAVAKITETPTDVVQRVFASRGVSASAVRIAMRMLQRQGLAVTPARVQQELGYGKLSDIASWMVALKRPTQDLIEAFIEAQGRPPTAAEREPGGDDEPTHA